MDKQNFLLWELSSNDTIDFKKVYVDMVDDLLGGLLLSQIVYWHLPSKETGRSKLRVTKEGHLWIAKGREDWYKEVRMSAKQYDRAIKILEKAGIVEVKTFKFDGSPMKHCRLLWDNFLNLLQETLEAQYGGNEGENEGENEDFEQKSGSQPLGDMVFPQRVKSNFPKGQNGNSPKGKMEIDKRVKSLTKNTDIDFNIDNNIEILDDEESAFGFQVNNFAFNELVNEFNENHPNAYDNDLWNRIYNEMIEQQIEIITYKEALAQAKYIKQRQDKGEIIADYAKYFVGGVKRKRTSQTSALAQRRLEKAHKEELERKKAQEQPRQRVEFYNWLEN